MIVRAAILAPLSPTGALPSQMLMVAAHRAVMPEPENSIEFGWEMSFPLGRDSYTSLQSAMHPIELL
jgi:hypothetical protein